MLEFADDIAAAESVPKPRKIILYIYSILKICNRNLVESRYYCQFTKNQ